MSFTLYPAIDLKDGRVVRLLQGRAEEATVYHQDPAIPANAYREAGAHWIHVVDLDGAFSGKPRNAEAVARITDSGLQVQLGGGIRDFETMERAFAKGVSRVVVGTRAARDPEFVREAVRRFGDRVAVGIDAKDGKVAVAGWVETLDLRVEDLAAKMEKFGVATVIYTDISTDGMLTGPNFEAQEALLRATGMRVIASGGVSRAEDVLRLAELAKTYPHLDGVIIGKALYEGRIDLQDLLQKI